MQFICKVDIYLLVDTLSTLSVVLKLSMDLFHLGVNKDSWNKLFAKLYINLLIIIIINHCLHTVQYVGNGWKSKIASIGTGLAVLAPSKLVRQVASTTATILRHKLGRLHTYPLLTNATVSP